MKEARIQITYHHAILIYDMAYAVSFTRSTHHCHQQKSHNFSREIEDSRMLGHGVHSLHMRADVAVADRNMTDQVITIIIIIIIH